ncbi:MAG: hypothetical protein AAF434_02245 [Pseudomonadota bacterium]
MAPTRQLKSQKSIQGAVLLLIVSVLVLGSAALFLGTQNLNRADLNRRDTVTRDLQKAKQSLIAFATNYADDHIDGGAGYGHFPCPDTDNDGIPDFPACPFLEAGRLVTHWTTSAGKAQELYPYAQESSRQFWYVTSPEFSTHSTSIVNPDTIAELTVDGIGDVVAVIVDPGPPLSGQTRPSDDVEDYLEGDNADGDENFVTSVDGEFNDRLIFITREEVMPLVEIRVLYYVLHQLEAIFADRGYLPYASLLGDIDDADSVLACVPQINSGFLPVDIDQALPGCDIGAATNFGAWVKSNRWHHHIYYHVDDNCDHEATCVPTSNTLEVTIDDELRERQSFMVAFFGEVIDALGQDRSNPVLPHLPQDYLDSPLSGDTSAGNEVRYEFFPIDAVNNDRALSCQLTGAPCS